MMEGKVQRTHRLRRSEFSDVQVKCYGASGVFWVGFVVTCRTGALVSKHVFDFGRKMFHSGYTNHFLRTFLT